MYRFVLFVVAAMAWPVMAGSEPNVSPDPARFARDIAEFEQWFSKNSPAKDPVLFVGNSSIRMWPTRSSFEGLPVTVISAPASSGTMR